MLRSIYSLAIYLAMPFIVLRLLLKSLKNPAYRQRMKERFACITHKINTNKNIWIHAVSLGESIAAIPLIKEIKKHFPQCAITVTCMTPTGSQKIKQVFGNNVHHYYAPYDAPILIKKFLKKIRPQLLIIMETELWPNILHYSKKYGTKIILANARLSPKSTGGYAKISSFTKEMLNNIDLIAAQTKEDQLRFIQLGAKENNTQNMGNIKFDLTIPENLATKSQALRQKWGEKRKVFIAGSTHQGEDEQIIAAYKIVKQQIPNLLLLLVPRHPERFSTTKELCNNNDLKIISYANKEACNVDTDVILGDIVGELLLLYGASDIAFVGGSLVPTGGHNLLEPAAIGIPVISGPNLFNFTEIKNLLLKNQALSLVNNPHELANVVINLFNDQELYDLRIRQAQKVLKQNRGAIKKLITIIKNII
ncbi:MAG: lipid IV(A) 3-deoxy-D-manno-octulosonic acid transferase [Gammaproteobacteria bacterium]|nr:lipid IV(A) 3-deoxy-D-manno-octulosonic acid transferase [Gammaproteobacteria bacterium]